MPDYTCTRCGNAFSLADSVVARYPGWTPPTCRPCRDETSGRARQGRSGRIEENLTLEQVLAKYSGGPQDGVFTDGSASPNPGPGGWGAVYVVDGEVVGQDRGAEAHTTNNRMELQALIAGVRLVPEGTPATVYTDSDLCYKTITQYAPVWEQRDWTRKGGPIKNLDLVRELYAVMTRRPELKMQWIKAHNGARWNEYADSLSTAYSRAIL